MATTNYKTRRALNEILDKLDEMGVGGISSPELLDYYFEIFMYGFWFMWGLILSAFLIKIVGLMGDSKARSIIND
jgi:hypothetical protein